ncbi:MAG: hypothetical protein RR140_00365 [Clostridia bacterium]
MKKTKNTIALTLFALCATLLLTPFCIFAQNFKNEVTPPPAEPVAPTFISTVEGIIAVKPKLDYVLSADLIIDNTSKWVPISTFSGVFDGNGKTITFKKILKNQNHIPQLFVETNGATIKNLKIEIEGGQITFSDSSFAIIIGNSTNTTIENCLIKSLETEIKTEPPVLPAPTDPPADPIPPLPKTELAPLEINCEQSLNIGIIAGTMSGGEIKNCKIDNVKLVVMQNNSASLSNIIGGIVGVQFGGIICNTIAGGNILLDCGSTFGMYLGGVAGIVKNNATQSKNIVTEFELSAKMTDKINSTENNIIKINNVNCKIGSVFGGIDGDITTLPNQGNLNYIFNVGSLNNLLVGENKAYQMGNLTIKDAVKSVFYSRTKYEENTWNVVLPWNFETVFMASVDNLPTLQRFQKFKVFASTDAKVLGMGVNGGLGTITENDFSGLIDKETGKAKPFVDIAFQLGTETPSKTSDNKNVEQGFLVPFNSSLKVYLKFTETTTNVVEKTPFMFDRFFAINGVCIGNNKIEVVQNTDGKSKAPIGNEIQFSPTTEHGFSHMITIPSFNSSLKGTYHVLLKKLSYNINFTTKKSNDDTLNLTVKGKVRDVLATQSKAELNFVLEYGKTIGVRAIQELNFAFDQWKLCKTKYVEGDELALLQANENQIFSANPLSIIFEKSNDFAVWLLNRFYENSKTDDPLTTDTNEAVYPYINENKPHVILSLVATFTDNVTKLNIKLNLDGTALASLGDFEIATSSVDVAEENLEDKNLNPETSKQFIKGKEIKIQIAYDNAKYVFAGQEDWQDGATLDNGKVVKYKVVLLDKDTYAVDFNFSTVEVEPVDLTWLWIVFGSVGGILILTTIIIVSVKKGKKHKRYKSFY